MDFCNNMCTSVETCDYLQIKSACRTMAEALVNKELLLEKDGNFDIGKMIDLRNERMAYGHLINNLKSKVMIEKNFEYLCEQHKEFGFGDQLNERLKEKMALGEPNIQLQTQVIGFDGKTVNATLNYSKSDQSEMYFWNTYKLHQVETNKGIIDQTFYVNKMNTFKIDEAVKLLKERSVYKTMQSLDKNLYSAWFTTDFSKKLDNGNFYIERTFGFNPEKEVRKLPIPGIDEKDSPILSEIVGKIKAGDSVDISLKRDGIIENVQITANPIEKKFNAVAKSGDKLDLAPFIEFKTEQIKAAKVEKKEKENVAANMVNEQSEKKGRKKMFGMF